MSLIPFNPHMEVGAHEHNTHANFFLLYSYFSWVRGTIYLSAIYIFSSSTPHVILGLGYLWRRRHRTFCVSVAGFRPFGEFSDAIFLPSYSTPTVHVLGKTDVIVVEERARTLIDVSANARVEYHDGGTCVQPSYSFLSSSSNPHPLMFSFVCFR